MSNPEMICTLLILAGAVILLLGNFIRNDLVGLLIILSLLISGVLDTTEALSGFSSTVVIIIAAMFIVGKAIIHTGIARRVGDFIIRSGGTNETKLMILLMAASALVGSFMSSTATAAIFIPITLTVADKANLNHKRLLMPLSIASLISGMMTLVATTPNIVVNSTLHTYGAAGFSFFSFTPFGMVVLIVAMAFMALVGRNFLASSDSKPERKRGPTIDDLLKYHKIEQNEYLLRVPPNSDLVGKSVASMQVNAQYHLILLAVRTRQSGRRRIEAIRPETVFREEDQLLLIGRPEHAAVFADTFALQKITLRPLLLKSFFQVVGIAEVMLNPDSTLIGKSLKDTGFQLLFHSMVLGIRRKGDTLTDDIASIPLAFGDVLLLCGAWTDILRLGQHKDQYLLLTLPQDYKEFIPAQNKQNLALAILVIMILLMAFSILPPVTAILAGSAALLLTRCVPLTSVYDVIDWQTIVMIAGMLPLALALQKTGVTSLVSAGFMSATANTGPFAVLSGLFLLTACIGCVLSNTAVAVLIAPMAIEVGLKTGINPEACGMVVAIACSAAFVSPLGSPVSMLVREPGGYSFNDYAKVGLPLLLLTLPVTILMVWASYL